MIDLLMLLIMGKKIFKLTDFFIILLAVGLTAFSARLAYMSPAQSRFLVQGQDQRWIFPMNASEKIIVTGPLGDTVVRIDRNSAWVESSPCQNQNCVASGVIKKYGSWAACLPNNVLLLIEGSTEGNEADAVTW